MEIFRIDVRAGTDAAELVLSGEADLAAAPQIIDRGTDRLTLASTNSLVADLGGVTFMDSTALGALVRLHNTAEQLGKRFTLVRVPDRVTKLFEITGVDTLFTVQALSADS
jgi:anti-sigma B factor antagonist